MTKFNSFLILSLLFFTISCTSNRMLSPGAQITTANPQILQSYSSYYIEPITVYALQDEELKFAEPSDVAELNELFRQKLLRQFGRKASNFPQASKGTAILSIAVSDVSVPQLIHQLKPNLSVPNADRGGAMIEARFLDSVSKKDLLTYRDSQTGNGESIFAGFDRWESLTKAFDSWAKELAQISK